MVSSDSMATTGSPAARHARAATWLPMARVMKNGDSSLANATNRTVRASGAARSRRASSSSAATPDPLSLAPGDPRTVS
jgi:hypothetical protein